MCEEAYLHPEHPPRKEGGECEWVTKEPIPINPLVEKWWGYVRSRRGSSWASQNLSAARESFNFGVVSSPVDGEISVSSWESMLVWFDTGEPGEWFHLDTTGTEDPTST